MYELELKYNIFLDQIFKKLNLKYLILIALQICFNSFLLVVTVTPAMLKGYKGTQNERCTEIENSLIGLKKSSIILLRLK